MHICMYEYMYMYFIQNFVYIALRILIYPSIRAIPGGTNPYKYIHVHMYIIYVYNTCMDVYICKYIYIYIYLYMGI
jgi:hypothetical protein